MWKKIARTLAALTCAAALLAGSAAALTVEEAIGLLETWYVDQLPPAAYQAEDLEGLMAAVGDPYTYYMTAQEYADFLGSMEDSVVTGIGVMVAYTDQGIRVEKVLEGGAAQAAGLVPGDLIVSVDGVSCVPANEGHRTLIVGEEGTSVTVTVLRADGTTHSFHLTRGTVTIPRTQASLLEGGIGYIDCDSFGSDTGAAFRDGVERYGSDAWAWLVDLRGNGGGVTDGAVAASSAFTGAGIKVYLRDGAGGIYYTASLQEDLTDLPVVILTNSATASASELFSAVLREEGQAISVGSRTYGKGVAQIVCDEENYAELFQGDALKITAYRFYTGGGNTTDRVGVIPTLVVSDEVAQETGVLLCGRDTGDGDCLRLTLGGNWYYVDLDLAASEAYAPAFAQLLSALPPQTEMMVGSGEQWAAATPQEAAELAGVTWESRYFADVADSPYADALNALAVCGVLQGTGGGLFQPEQAMTRGQLCALLAQALNAQAAPTGGYFSDVAAGAWYAQDVEAMASMGLVAGFPDGTFRPDQTVTQEEFLTVMGRLAAFLNLNVDLERQQFDGSGAAAFASWAAPWAQLLDGRSMLYTDLDAIAPKSQVTREQAGATLYLMLTELEILVQ